MKRTSLFGASAAALLTAALVGPAAGQTLTIGLQDDADKLDPALARTFVGRIVFASLCDKLVDITPGLDFTPMLATSWEWSDDGKALAFELRDDVVFHDGTKFDAEAVKFNIERSKTIKGSNRASEIRPVQNVVVESPTRVVLELDEPFVPLIAALSDRAGMMISPKAAQEAEANGTEFAANPVCSGPFKFTERVAQDRIVVDRFEDYWNKDAIHLDRVVFRPIADQTVRLANLQAGDLDIAERVSPQDLQTIEDDPNTRVERVTGLGYQGITVNINNGPRADNPLGQDPRVREALELSIDREALNQVAFNGAQVPNNQPVAPDNPYYAKDVPIPARDVERAKALLKEAGQERVSFELMTSTATDQQQVGQIVQAMAAEAGFDIKLTAIEFAAALDRQTRGDFEAFLVGWSGRVDPDGNIHIFTETNGALNDGKYSNPQVDELLNEARTVADPEARKKLYADAAAIYLAERPRIYLWHVRWLYGVREEVKGFTPYPDGLIRPFGIEKSG